MQKYNPQKIESKWQSYWEKNKLNQATDNDKRPKFYCLDMFPYPSAEGLHVGHPEGYTAADIYCRYLRMNGYNVLHPMGWDAFGLPAENYAIKTKKHPKTTTKKNIDHIRQQIKALGFSYDWDREIDTSNPSYYKWTQWLFLQLYKKGLAYQKMAPVNWCNSCQTVLAREQVIDGKCERCKNQVTQKELKQWFFRITNYADKLLADLADLDWPENIKLMQENWIGRSEGTLIRFAIQIEADQKTDGSGSIRSDQFSNPFKSVYVEVFTTRPDTLFGATYMVLAPEHKIISNFQFLISNWKEVKDYIERTKEKTELERTSLEKTKTGVELKGIKAINPANKKEIPIFIADYVLTTYGTGAIMAVPAHDERDFEFAKKYRLPIIEVIKFAHYAATKHNSDKTVYTGEGKMINSGKFNGMSSEKAREAITELVKGKKSTQYRLRDWLISRQRYWGAPIPIIYCDKCGAVSVSEKDLPVDLPDDVDFQPKGESPLVSSKKFHKVKCPKCQSPARRESDTMDTFVCSSWYYLRYCDPNNNKQFANRDKLKYWLPVDLYVGGAEHAVMHLLYARFMTKALRDLGYLKFAEPFLKLRNQGLILAPDGRKMSKSLGNVINPDDVIAEYGADTMRMYEMFMGPLEDEKPWNTKGIIGIKRFLDRVWKFIQTSDNSIKSDQALQLTIQKVTEDIKALNFNTAISAMMIYINQSLSNKTMINKQTKEQFLKILSPFAPHLAEELWSQLNNKKSIFLEKWPKYEEIKAKEVTVVVQINGKVRTKLFIDPDLSKEKIEHLVFKEPNVQKWIKDKRIKKIIYISGKILSIVI